MFMLYVFVQPLYLPPSTTIISCTAARLRPTCRAPVKKAVPVVSRVMDRMEKEENYSLGKMAIGDATEDNGYGGPMIDYMVGHPPQQQRQQFSASFAGSSSLDKLSFADVMQFADFGPKLALNQSNSPGDEPGIDPVCFLKFPVLSDHHNYHGDKMMDGHARMMADNSTRIVEDGEDCGQYDEETQPVQLQFIGEDTQKNSTLTDQGNKNKKKRPRTLKTTEEVESQRMTHIAVERNRRRQMNEHLRVLRSLMPSSYIQRGDQASIIGGAIEFVRELEQLLQCLESQKRRRLYGDGGAPPPVPIQQGPVPPQEQQQQQMVGQFLPPGPLPGDHQMKMVDLETGLREETAESKSCVADVEVKMLGFDAMIKILSRRRPGQLIKTIAALEDLQLNILHTNITTIEQTVLYSFNVKASSDARLNAEDIAGSVQQIFGFIHANSSV
ncbi:hypothetical protein MLD38_027198 [Melastoma candidum]|uniref:Uncharacterized protein n=1 Tax=Melastoma candidum TaxID=119954 RepID=A0ACB9P2B8_9MYRT|nr:hypothetical protein MLD38_027198 [Melastoma candidum]